MKGRAGNMAANGDAIGRGKVHGTLGAQVTSIIGRRIVSGALAPGAALPSEGELCLSLGVSRTTLREAIKKLHAKGLLAVGPRNGTRVLEPANWSQLDIDVLSWRIDSGFDEKVVAQLYELRECFEPQVCALAAIHGADADLRNVEARFRHLVAVHEDPKVVTQADVDFHMAIVAATRNIFFISVGAAISAALRVSFDLGTARGFPPDELRLHEEICKAVVRRRPEAAAQLMRRLIAASRASLTATLKKRPARRLARREFSATLRPPG
jgi:DNA-binding FadR family transcriptional regulator